MQRFLTLSGVGVDRVRTVSYGEERPADSAHFESAWSRNRRVEFQVAAGSMTGRSG